MDNAIYHALWRWATRRHPRKPRTWIKARYWPRQGCRNWVFTGTVNGKPIRLARAADTPIRRHVKIRGDANPYDPAQEAYFERRLDRKMEVSLAGRRTLLYLWKRQHGRCPVCHTAITERTGWHSHHVRERSLGGPDTADNRVLLHPTCHRQVHSQEYSVPVPRPVTRASGKA